MNSIWKESNQTLDFDYYDLNIKKYNDFDIEDFSYNDINDANRIKDINQETETQIEDPLKEKINDQEHLGIDRFLFSNFVLFYFVFIFLLFICIFLYRRKLRLFMR